MVSLDEVTRSRKRTAGLAGAQLAQSASDRADRLPTSGFWLEVDGRTKKGWAELDTARREAKALKQRYPHLRVAVYNAAESTRTLPD